MPFTNVRDKPKLDARRLTLASLRSRLASTQARSGLNAKRGFSLVEILLALFFVAALGTILLTSSGTLLTTRRSNLQTTAAKLASKEIESLRNATFTSLPAGGSNTSCTSVSSSDLQPLKSSSCSRLVTNYDSLSDAATQIKQITVTVQWNNDGPQQNITMDTLIYKNGL